MNHESRKPLTHAIAEADRKELSRILQAMHKIAFPGEYGLGDRLTNKEAWIEIGKLIEEGLKVV